jgi:hypothetical protein
MSIVNRCDVNLENAFRAKEARNETRVWARSGCPSEPATRYAPT